MIAANITQIQPKMSVECELGELLMPLKIAATIWGRGRGVCINV